MAPVNAASAALQLARAPPCPLPREHRAAWHLTGLKPFAVQMLIKLYNSFVRQVNTADRRFSYGPGLPLPWKVPARGAMLAGSPGSGPGLGAGGRSAVAA